MDNLNWFRAEVERLAKVIGASSTDLPTFGQSEDFARPHIEYSGGQWHFVVIERGEEQARTTSTDPEPILYEVFDGITFTMACNYEFRSRRKGEDSRRQLFDVQLDLLGRLSNEWRRRKREDFDSVLRDHPFRDT